MAFDYGEKLEQVAHAHLRVRGWKTDKGLSDAALGLAGLDDLTQNAIIAFAKREVAWVCDERPSEFASPRNPMAGQAIPLTPKMEG